MVSYSGGVAYQYSSMTEILSGNTGGTSLLTGLTIPIVLTQSFNDIGYYSEFDGAVIQKQALYNFVYSAATDGFTYYVVNTSDRNTIKYLGDSVYLLDWGDGFPIVNFTNFSTPLSHTYPSTSGQSYVISMTGSSPWGTNIIKSTISIPSVTTNTINPFGTVTFTPSSGNWSGIPVSYDYIFTGDAINLITAQTSDNYTTVPFLITGYTKSRLQDLQAYGNVKYRVGYPITGSTGWVGVYNGPSPSNPNIIQYTIDGVLYEDYPDGRTYYRIMSSGITQNTISQSAITKDEALMGVVFAPAVQSSVYVDRGKNSVLETVQRLGEVDNIGDLVKYGYGFFNVKSDF